MKQIFLLMAMFVIPAALRAESSADYCGGLKKLSSQGQLTQDRCGIVRGPVGEKKIALIFTGGSFAEGAPDIIKALDSVDGKASFFLTGDFLRDPKFKPVIEQLKAKGHYLGPHSNKHLNPVDDNEKTRVTREAFGRDLQANVAELEKVGVKKDDLKYWIVPSETYNEEISRWSKDEGIRLINYTPGTRSNADYMEDKERGFVSNEKIKKSILDANQKDQGLNGYLLLLHLGVGPKRTLPFSAEIPELLQTLKKQGYSFVRVDSLLDPALEGKAPKAAAPAVVKTPASPLPGAK